jgi:hypothetical protein
MGVVAGSRSGRDADFLIDLGPQLVAPLGEQNPVVNLPVGNYEAHRVNACTNSA